MKFIRPIFLFILFLLVLQRVPAIFAFEVQSGKSVQIDRSQSVIGSLFVSGTNVAVDGAVHGDVYCAGDQVTISSLVDGDVICAAQSIHITGVVLGNVRLAAKTVDIAGTVKENGTILAQTLTVPESGRVNGELFTAVQTLDVNGLIGNTIGGYAQDSSIGGRVNNDIDLSTQSLDIGPKAVIAGDLRYTSDTDAVIAKGASISGKVTKTTPKEQTNTSSPAVTSARRWPANAIPSILWNLIIGILIVQFFPTITDLIGKHIKESPVRTALVGLFALVVVPMVGIIFVFTLLGIPIALLIFLLYALALVVCRVFLAVLVGEYIVDSFSPKASSNKFINMLIGVPVLWFIFKAPYVGGLLSFIAVILGLGGMVQTYRFSKRRAK